MVVKAAHEISNESIWRKAKKIAKILQMGTKVCRSAPISLHKLS